LPGQPSVQVPDPGPDHEKTYPRDDPPAGRPVEDPRCDFLLVLSLPGRLVRVEDELGADEREPRVQQPAGGDPDPLERSFPLAGLELAAECGLREAPDRVAREADRNRRE
jgi:hypothetical protein